MSSRIIKWSRFLILLPILVIQNGCKKLVEVTPPITTLTGATVFTTDANAISAVTGIYSGMMNTALSGGIISLSLYPGLSADELSVYGTNTAYSPYYTNSLSSSTSGNILWNSAYPIIYNLNSAIEGINSATTLTPSIKKQLLGEVKFVRAFCYFYLVNFYGDVPLILSSDYEINRSISRTSQDKVYQQITADLIEAKDLLSQTYLDASFFNSTLDRVRPTQWAASSLLARVYLFQGKWSNADTESSLVINKSSLFNLSPLDSVFNRASQESIWQLQPVQITGQNTPDALLFVLPNSGPSASFPIFINNSLMGSFEAGDKRKQSWTKSVISNLTTFYYPYKYKINTITNPVKEYEMVFRLGEQYLIRAEARAQQDKLTDSKTDVDIIRKRANLPPITLTTKNDLLNTIYHERAIELFSEWGHRWLDLKRLGLIDNIMNTVATQKGGSWQSYEQWYPIPISEIRIDPALSQNSGY